MRVPNRYFVVSVVPEVENIGMLWTTGWRRWRASLKGWTED